MSNATVSGSFAASANSTVGCAGVASDICDVPYDYTTMRVTLTGLDASNTVKTQKNTSPGGAWVDQVTYNSNQANIAVTVSKTEQWRLVCVAQQPGKEIRYKLSVES